MPAIAPLTLDMGGTSTVFNPVGTDSEKGLARYLTSATTLAEASKLSISVLPRTDAKTRVRAVLAVPSVVSETINGVSRSKVERTAYADVQFTFDPSSTAAEREALVDGLADLITTVSGEDAFKMFIENEGIY